MIKKKAYVRVVLTDVCEFEGGTQPPKDVFVNDRRDGYIRLIQIQDFERHDKQVFIPDVGNLRKCQTSDVLIARYGASLGRILTGLAGAYNVALVKTVPDDKRLARKFLYFLLRSETFQQFLANVGSRAAQAGFNKADLSRFEFSLPPLPEQKRIANILDKADAIRRKRQEAAEQCNDFLTSTFNAMFGDPVRNPNKWPETTLDDVAHLQSGVTKGRQFADQQTVNVPYMRVWNVQDGHLRLDDIKDITVLPADVEKYSLQEGDLLLTEGGDPDQLGRGAIWYAPIPVCIHQNHIFRVRCDQKVIIPEFLSALIGSPKGKRYFFKMAKQTTGIASINMTQLRKCPVFLPPLHLQQQFAKLDRQFEKTCGTLNKRFDTVDQLFGSLVQRAFKGEL